jgi:hypothetical protein
MAVVFTPARLPSDIQSMGSMFVLVGTLTFSGSYATGGDPLDLTKYFGKVGAGKGIIVTTTARGNEVEYDETNKKIKLWGAANTEVAAAAYNAALTATPVPVVIIGR